LSSGKGIAGETLDVSNLTKPRENHVASVISRRHALAMAGGSFAVMGLPGAMAADAPRLVRVSVVPIYVVHSHFAADAQGYFAAEGIVVETQPVHGGAFGIPGLVSGSFDVLYTNTVSVLTALERGIDLRIIAEGPRTPTSPPDPLALFKRKGDKISSGKDLEGKVIAINALFTLQWLTMQRWIKQAGGDLSKVTYREIPLPSMADALKSKQVDAAYLLDPYLTLAFDDPSLDLAAWPTSTCMPGLSSSLWIVSGKWADAKPELVRAYARGFFKGGQWVNDNLGKQAYYDLIAGFTKIDPARLAKMLTGGQVMEIQAAPINGLASVMREFDLLKSNVDVESKIFRVQ
jgi:NitT/TauT family transport system substrate-binding protein